jgi:hypothetical protein
MPLLSIRGGSLTVLAGQRLSMKQLGKSLTGTDWRSYSANWSGNCAQPWAATRVMLFGRSSASPTPAAWLLPGTISVTFLHLLRRLS